MFRWCSDRKSRKPVLDKPNTQCRKAIRSCKKIRDFCHRWREIEVYYHRRCYQEYTKFLSRPAAIPVDLTFQKYILAYDQFCSDKNRKKNWLRVHWGPKPTTRQRKVSMTPAKTYVMRGMYQSNHVNQRCQHISEQIYIRCTLHL